MRGVQKRLEKWSHEGDRWAETVAASLLSLTQCKLLQAAPTVAAQRAKQTKDGGRRREVKDEGMGYLWYCALRGE